MYRVDLEIGVEHAEIVEVDRSTLPAGYVRPVPWLGMGATLVAWSGDQVVDAVPVRASSEVVMEWWDEDGRGSSRVVYTDSAVTTVWVRAEQVDRLELLGVDGSTLDALDTEAFASSSEGLSEDPDVGAARQQLSHHYLADYPHIRVLDPGEGHLLPEAIRPGTIYTEALAEVTPDMIDRTLEALQAMAPGPRAAISTIAFVYMPEEGWAHGWATSTSVIINAELYDGSESLDRLLMHEGMHALDNVLSGTFEPGTLELMPPEVRRYLQGLMDDYRTQYGYRNTWNHAHQTAVETGYAVPYGPDHHGEIGDAEAVDLGFATGYGSTLVHEDIAEFAAVAQIAEGDDHVCDRFRAYTGSDFPEELAIHFVKLHMLQAVEAVDDTPFDRCLGSVDIDGPSGIHLGDAISFTRDLNAGFYEPEGVPFFAVLGRGPESYGLLLRVYTPDFVPPLGLHSLNNILFPNVGVVQNGVYLTHDADTLARASGGGVVLFSEVSEREVRGAVFFLTLQNAFGTTTDVFPYSTFLVR